MDKVTAWKEIMLRWTEIQELWRNHFDIDNERMKLKLVRNVPQLSYGEKPKRVNSHDFEVRFSSEYNNCVLSTKKSNASDLLRQFIDIVGAENVKTLNVPTVGGGNLIVEITKGVKKYSVFTKTSNSEKKDSIRQIIQALKIKAEIIDL